MPTENERIAAFLVDSGILPTEDIVAQTKVFLEALTIMDNRSAAYGEVWRQYGARSNILSVARKVDRIMHAWWFNTDDGAAMLSKGVLDDALDLMNYCAFFLRNAKALNVEGRPPVRLIKDNPQA